ncbi:unnamed protein product, partial [marine sediment metagenome]
MIEKWIKNQLKSTTHTVNKIKNDFNKIKGLKTCNTTIKGILIKAGLESRFTKRENPAHPNLNENYFEIIDTKEKAYWLGFLYADGNVQHRADNVKRLRIGINKKDRWLIDTFVEHIYANKEKIFNDGNLIRFEIANKKLCNDLIKQGCHPVKSLNINFPKLENRELELAFLLGYFDGDGTQGTSKITSGSKTFLNQIKYYFEIKNKIHRKSKNQNSYD